MKAIVLTCDRYRAITEHMIGQYERLWPDHPFVFRVPYQDLIGQDTERTKYVKTPAAIKATVLQLISDLPDEEWIYWCVDDKYPIRLMTEKITRFIKHAIGSPKMDGLLFCRCRTTLDNPKRALYRREWVNSFGDIYFERKGWFQIWIHQLLKAKVLRYLFTQMPDHITNARKMDEMKWDVPKLREHRLFVTKENFAIFGESTEGGAITQNCYDSIVKTNIALPDWFRNPNGRHVTLGVL